MLYRVDWQVESQNRDDVFARFVDSRTNSGYDLPDGLIMVGRWHDVCALKGTSIWKTDDVELLMQWMQLWNEKLELAISPCIDDEAAGRICADTLAIS